MRLFKWFKDLAVDKKAIAKMSEQDVDYYNVGVEDGWIQPYLGTVKIDKDMWRRLRDEYSNV